MNNRSVRQKRTTPSFNQIYQLSKPKQEIIKIQSKNDEITRNEKITEIYNSEYEDFFENILLISKVDFLKEISNRIELIIKELFTEEEIKEKSFKDYITESNKIINEKYQNNYNILSKSYNNYLKRPKNFSYLKHFRKHCIHTDDYAYHSCEYENSKLIEIKDEKNKNEITHFICLNCKKSYLPKKISLICNYCKINYFSCLLNKDEDPNIQPATWEKYHCQNLINDSMKCLKCKNILYLNIRENKLICLNKKCNFTAKPQSIIWNCLICKKEFKSDAKIYNPLEIKIMKRSVRLALIFKIPIYPNEIPCCKANPKELIFYHKNECKGELYEGNFNNKNIIVCSKCHAVNFYDKFIWTCPLCKKRFRTTFFRSNTNDKFTSFRVSESNFSNFINNYNTDYNPMLRSTSGDNKFLNSFHSTLRFTTSFNDNKNQIVNLVTEVYPNSRKKNNDNNNDNDNNDNDNKQIKNKKQYSTLIEILAERNNNKLLDNNDSNYNIILGNNSNYNSRVNSRKNRFKKNKSEVNLEENGNINKIVNENNNNKDNIIIVNNNENNNNEINLNALRKIASVSTNDHSLSNKSYGNSSNPPTNKIKKITVNKNENNNEDDESILKMNNQNSRIRNRRLRNRIENDNILNNRKESKILNEENYNNNSQISIRKQLENQINKKTEKSIREKERENKKEKSQEIYKKPNKEIEEINTPEKNQLNTLIPNKKKRKYDITPPRQIIYKKNHINNKKEIKNNEKNENKENNENNEEDILTSPEQLKEVIKNGKIPSFNIENFIFKNPIGEGSFGKIYLIQKEKTHEKYALKKIICHDLEEIKHFQKEFELVYSKVHNNIMKIYNIEYKCLDSTTYSIYVLMELAISDWNNEINRRLKKREYYTETEIVKLLNQILDALIFLEKNGIAHRDIKPQNILIYPNNVYKVADFGEARNLSDSIQECTIRGSELYMSPVLYYCLKNREKDVIHNAYKSDVFSLGFCLLYAMVLTVKVLNDIREINNMNVISLIIKKALRRNYSNKMQVLINGMLELDENKRFSFEDIKKYLKENF